MSSILKALKKIEIEKSRRENQISNIGLDILREGHRSGYRRDKGWWVAGGLVVAGLVCGMVFWLVPRGLAPAPISGTPFVPEVPGKPSPSGMLPPVSSGPANPVSPTITELPAYTVPKPPVAANPPILEQAPPVLAPPARSQSLSVPASPVPGAASDGLTLQGIVWQDDSAARMAIINDLPVMKGTRIEDATVEEILADRVRLSRHGITFELTLKDR